MAAIRTKEETSRKLEKMTDAAAGAAAKAGLHV
jgi:hypothetical protein